MRDALILRRRTVPSDGADGRQRWGNAIVGALAVIAVAGAPNAQPVATADPSGLHIVISVRDRTLWVLDGADTLRAMPVAVGRDARFSYQGREWLFQTKRGRYAVMKKDSLPVWVPPDWHYYEVAREQRLLVKRLEAGQRIPLLDGGLLEVRADVIGVIGTDSTFTELPVGDEIIFDGILFVPPMGTRNRQIAGELGRYRLDLGDGYALHGTPYLESIGAAVTHGCVRVGDGDLDWLYRVVPVGTPVLIY